MSTLRAFVSFVCNTGLLRPAHVMVILIAAATTSLVARDGDPAVQYQPSLKLIEGDQPLNTSYVLSITSPSNVPTGSNLVIRPVIASTTTPAGVSTATALSFISLSPSALTFTGPNQTLTTTITASVPEGTIAGNYVWSISTPGWPAGTVEEPAAINAKVTVPQLPFPPTVALTSPTDNAVYTYTLGGPPVSIPLTFTATAPTVSPITSIDADISGTGVILAATGIGTASVNATGTLLVSTPGVYTVRARATNNVNTSADTSDITVKLAVPPPVVAIVQPTASLFVYNGSALSIPFSFTSTSLQGGTTSLAATLNGNPVAVTSSGLGSLLATGSGTLTVNGAGSYTLVVSGTTANGTSTATKAFSVASAQSVNPPTVTISQPLNGAVITRIAGSPATSVPFAFAAAADVGTTISSIKGTLNGSPVTVTASGIGSASASGSGSFSINTAGTYTFVATAVAGTLTGSKSVTFTVKETTPTPDCTIDWLPPISLGKVQKGGSVLPIKFDLDCGCSACGGNRDDNDCNDSHRRCGWGWGWGRGNDKCENEHDTSVVIFIYEIKANGSTTEPEIFTYSRQGKCSDRDDTYEIDGNHYQLNYVTDRGAHRYHIDVYRKNPNSGAAQLLGTKEFTTK